MTVNDYLSNKETLLSLHRYYIWANKMRDHFDESLKLSIIKNAGIESFMYMSYWYASIYVVTEGWFELGFEDHVIDELLKSDNLDLLKRYRHGVFHYQKQYNDMRFLELLKNGENAVEWVRKLNKELGRYFLNELKNKS